MHPDAPDAIAAMTTSARSHYQTLGVAPDATAAEVRLAYRKLAQKHHPDRNAGNTSSERAMARVNSAYAVLGNEQQRGEYDERLAEAALRKDQTWARAAMLVPSLSRSSWTLVFGVSALSIATFGFATLYAVAPPKPVVVLPATVSSTAITTDRAKANQPATSLGSAQELPAEPSIQPWREPPPSKRTSFAATDPVTRLVRDGVKP